MSTSTIRPAVLRPAIVMFAALTLITGVVYPLVVTGISQGVFPAQAAGSLVNDASGKPIGSLLIGQNFTSPRYFWGRPSVTSPMANNAANSAGSNLGPMNPALTEAVKGRIDALKAADPANQLPIPVDLVTASASGVDPEISVAAARYQAARVARARGLAQPQVDGLIDQLMQGQLLGFLGEPRVNVLQLNLALDALKS